MSAASRMPGRAGGSSLLPAPANDTVVDRDGGVNRKHVEQGVKYVEDSATHPGRGGSDLPEIPWAAESPAPEREGPMGAVVEAEPRGNRAHLIAGFAKHENRRLGADSLGRYSMGGSPFLR